MLFLMSNIYSKLFFNLNMFLNVNEPLFSNTDQFLIYVKLKLEMP